MAKNTKNLLILVDGSSYLYRAYHALPQLPTPDGAPTGAIYGVLSMLRSLLLAYQPQHLAVVFDAKGTHFRNELFPEYKSHRQPMPDKLRAQIKPLYEIIKAMGLALLIIPGVEADDVIGTLAIKAEITGSSVLISTGDKDMAQLVTPNISLINTMHNAILGPKEVYSKYGVPPELIIDLIALMGDTSDNIPGIPGIGAKTAKAMLRGIGGLDMLYNNLNIIATLNFRGAKNIANKLVHNKKIAYLSYKLAKIKTDVKLEPVDLDLNISMPNFIVLKQLFKKYAFRHWLTNIENGTWLENKKQVKTKKTNQVTSITAVAAKTNTKTNTMLLQHNNYTIILDNATLIDWIQQLKKATMFAFDTKTDGLNALSANLIGLSFAIEPGKSAYVPMADNCIDVPEKLDRTYVLKILKPLLESEAVLKVGINTKFDISILGRYDINLRGITCDIMLASYILGDVSGRKDIASLANHYLGHNSAPLGTITEKSKDQFTIKQIDWNQPTSSAAKYADTTMQLHLAIWPQLKKSKGLLKIFTEIEMPLVRVLSHIERAGVLIDRNILSVHSQELSKKLSKLEMQAHELAGENFNLSSPKQLQAILYEKQKLPVLKKTPRGAPSTNEEVLSKLAIDFELPQVMLQYRSLAKLKTNYTDKLPLMINPDSGRVHTSYHQDVTLTGRLSSSDPNLQNIPARNDEGRRIRQAFIAPKGYRIVAADYSQIELRIIAHLSQDKSLLKAFAEDADIHRTTAADMFSIPLDDVSREQRRSAKAINFGLIYGMSAFGLARQLTLPQHQAEHYMNRYFKRYPGVLDYIQRTRKQSVEQNYVNTLDGRLLYLTKVNASKKPIHQKTVERTAINAPMQGTAADIIKRAMINLDAWIQKQEHSMVRMIIQVHDELVFEVHESALEVSIWHIRKIMESSIVLTVPLKVKIGVGFNWDDAH